MKCEVAGDLLTLYVEELCSPEAAKELEAHLEGCPKCRERLERYKEGIEKEKKLQKEKNEVENAKELNPWKKVRIKNIIKMLLAIFLTIFFMVALAIIGVLCYGQVTNAEMGFSTIADIREVKKICENLTKGETQDLLDAIVINGETVYANRGTGQTGFSDITEMLKADMDTAYEYHFKGKNVSVKIENVAQMPFSDIWFVDEPHTNIIVGFYEGDEQIYTMNFGKVSTKKYWVTESLSEEEPGFLERVLPDVLGLDICLRYVMEEQYEKLCAGEEVKSIGAGLTFIIKKGETEEEQSAYQEQLRKKIAELYDNGWYIKKTMLSVEEYDEAAKRWIYKVWFMWEDQRDKDTGIIEYKFHYYDGNLYGIDGVEPVILSGEDVFTQEVEQQVMNLFE